jgi:dihydrodipicolinate synthase/N-acetylneuraminate lyase
VAEFEGVVPALVTPMDSDGELDEKSLRKVIEFNVQSGVHGMWMAGGTGESILLTDEENGRIAQAAVDQVKGRAKIIMHVGAPTTTRAVKMATVAAHFGVDAICCVPPFFYPPGEDEVIDHFRQVAAAASLPFFAYNLPQCTGFTVTPEFVAKARERVPELIGLKHSSHNLYHLREFVRAGLTCFMGSGQMMLPAMTLGAAGCIDGPLCMAPELWLELWRAFHSGELERASKAQEHASRLTDLVWKHGNPRVEKAVLSWRLDIDCGDPRPPRLPFTEQQRSQVLAAVAQLGIRPVDLPL